MVTARASPAVPMTAEVGGNFPQLPHRQIEAESSAPKGVVRPKKPLVHASSGENITEFEFDAASGEEGEV